MLWYRNDIELHPLDGSEIDFSDDMAVLTIFNATYDDSGLYQCRASNNIGIVRSSRVVFIHVISKLNVSTVYRFNFELIHILISG